MGLKKSPTKKKNVSLSKDTNVSPSKQKNDKVPKEKKAKDGRRGRKTKGADKEKVEEAASVETVEKVNEEMSEAEAEKRADDEVENDGEDGDEGKSDDDKEENERQEEDEEERDEQEDNEQEAEEREEDGRDIRGESNEQDISDDEEDARAIQPERMWFFPTDYTKAVKIGTRCNVRETVEFLEKFPAEMEWFRAHEQFRHVFHMPREANHMTQGMWMLMLHATRTEVDNESWFLVNGRLIRYSIREHALLTGLNCKNYPANWKQLGSLQFAIKMFKKTEVAVKDVKEKLERMKNKNSTDRKKLAVLYFLCRVLKAKSKHNGKIDSFLLSIVDDLRACETFPWGRYTFNDCMEGIKSFLSNMGGVVKEGAQPMISGFIIPLEVNHLPPCWRKGGR